MKKINKNIISTVRRKRFRKNLQDLKKKPPIPFIKKKRPIPFIKKKRPISFIKKKRSRAAVIRRKNTISRHLSLRRVSALVHIKCTSNNTLVCVKKHHGNPIISLSSGMVGYKGSAKSTAYATKQLCIISSRRAYAKGIRIVEVITSGIHYRKRNAIKGIKIGGLHIYSIVDTTSLAHNGCKRKKTKRK